MEMIRSANWEPGSEILSLVHEAVVKSGLPHNLPERLAISKNLIFLTIIMRCLIFILIAR